MTTNFVYEMAARRICPNSGHPQTPYEHGAVRQLFGFGMAAIAQFVEETNRRAEANMEKTHRLEGSHYAAMTQLLAELQGEARLE